ncbi:hypothetical protein [Streptomyces sp. NPDC058092]|uniref:hypothetical protein n=1 Tax=Streptomyces sp. NPDC058092 TaxID=3346336 RepID=UPI0036DFD890
MTVPLGDKRRFAVEIGDRDHGLRRVDLWAAGQWLTCDDNMAFVAQFRHTVLETANCVRSGKGSPLPWPDLPAEVNHRRLLLGSETPHDTDAGPRGRYRGLEWGPTTDNLISSLFRNRDSLTLTFEFWRKEHLLTHPAHAGHVFVVEVPVPEFVEILDGLVTALDDIQHERLPAGD